MILGEHAKSLRAKFSPICAEDASGVIEKPLSGGRNNSVVATQDLTCDYLLLRYFTDAGFEVLGMEGMDTSPDEADKISTETIYQHLQASFNKFPPAQGIYLLGGAWGVKDIIAAENIWAFPWFIRLPPGFGTCKSF